MSIKKSVTESILSKGYGLDCVYYKRTFPTLQGLIDDVLRTGMDANYQVTLDGEETGDILFDLIQW